MQHDGGTDLDLGDDLGNGNGDDPKIHSERPEDRESIEDQILELKERGTEMREREPTPSGDSELWLLSRLQGAAGGLIVVSEFVTSGSPIKDLPALRVAVSRLRKRGHHIEGGEVEGRTAYRLTEIQPGPPLPSKRFGFGAHIRTTDE